MLSDELPEKRAKNGGLGFTGDFYNPVIYIVFFLLTRCLGGGFPKIFYFHPTILGDMIPNLTVAYFSIGLVQPPTSLIRYLKLQ